MNRFRVVRRRLDMLQGPFGELIDASTSSVSRIEQGTQEPNDLQREKLVLLEAALSKDEALGARVAQAQAGLTGFRAVHAAWVEVLK